MSGELVSFLMEWDEKNLDMIREQGIGRGECEQMIAILVAHSGSRALWTDTVGSKKEWSGQRFVAVVSKPSLGRRFFICFTVRSKGVEKAVRIIQIRDANRREPLCWEDSKRFIVAPSLRQLLGV